MVVLKELVLMSRAVYLLIPAAVSVVAEEGKTVAATVKLTSI